MNCAICDDVAVYRITIADLDGEIVDEAVLCRACTLDAEESTHLTLPPCDGCRSLGPICPKHARGRSVTENS
jgi:hypothetical protein